MPKLLYVVGLLPLFTVTPLMAQQLVREDDRNNPCRRFKMIVLVPVDVPTRGMPVISADTAIDPKMVWNPCPSVQPQVASIQPSPKSPVDLQVTPPPFFPGAAPQTLTSDETRRLLDQLYRKRNSNPPK